MADSTADAAVNAASRRRKTLIIRNVLVGLFTGAYTVSPIDLLPEVLLGPIGLSDDLLGIVMAIGFTIYTIRKLREIGPHALMHEAIATLDPRAPTARRALTTGPHTEDTPTIVDVKVEGTDRIPGYDPVPADKIKSL